MADLVSGRYGQLSPFQALLGGLAGSVQANLPVRSNLEYLGYSGATDAAALVTNKLVCVAVPVDIGATYKTVTFHAGATAPTLTHNYAAVYSGGTGAGTASTLLAQSTDATSTAPTASQLNSYTLASPVTATAANAPNGYWYVGLQQTGTANSAAGATVATAVQLLSVAVATAAPVSLGFSVAATTGTAPANLGSPTPVSLLPFVWLS